MQTPATPEDDAVPPMTLFDGNTLVFTTVIAAGSIALPVLALSRHGWWDTAGAVLVGALWLAITLYCFHSGYGLHSSLVMAYLPCALYAMLFLGPRTALCTLGLTLAALALLHVAEESGVVGGAHAVARTGTRVAYLCGIVSALGVDLAIARRIVECHGGEFHAHGAASGGLAVIFTLDGAADPAPPARQ